MYNLRIGVRQQSKNYQKAVRRAQIVLIIIRIIMITTAAPVHNDLISRVPNVAPKCCDLILKPRYVALSKRIY